MSSTNVFGRIVSAGMVERALVATLGKWIDSYLGEIERLEGYVPNSIQRPLGVVTASEFDKWPEDQIPVILVTNAATAQVERHANGSWNVVWRIGVAPIVSDTDEIATRTLSMAYATAVRTLLLQKKRLKSDLFPDGIADYTWWRGEDYTPVPFTESRTLAAGISTVDVGVENAVTEFAGPTSPVVPASTDPGALPEVETVNIYAGIGAP